jgi:hypothetical protein
MNSEKGSRIVEILLDIGKRISDINDRLAILEDSYSKNQDSNYRNQSEDQKAVFYSLSSIELSDQSALRRQDNLNNMLGDAAFLAIEHYRLIPPRK